MTNAEKIVHDNLKYKYEKLKAAFDTVEQEKIDSVNENKLLKKENVVLKKNNEKLVDICDKKTTQLYDEIGKLNNEILQDDIKKKEYKADIETLTKKVETLEGVVLDLKSSKIKDSTNSSKPSSTNGYKKVIQNNREKSQKSKGGQKGRIGKTLNEIETPDKVVEVTGEAKCECGGEIIYSKIDYIKKQVIDIINDVEAIEYRYCNGKCNKCGKEYMARIPQEHANPVQYSEKIKRYVPIIRNISNMSVETTKNVFGILFKGVPMSTGFIHKQDEILAKKCSKVVENMKDYLKMVDIAHSDETSIKIDDKLGCCLSFSDQKVVVYGMYNDKSKNSFDEFGIYKTYTGILVHDHNKTYYMYTAMQHAECNVHIIRYLKHVIEVQKREGAEKLKKYLLDIYNEKIEAITQGKEGLSEERKEQIEKEYLQIIQDWEKEYNEAVKKLNKVPKIYNEEKNLFERLREYKEEHLRFIKDFRVPFSNNEAERNLRKIKMKINVSKRFGKLERAQDYAIIKSIIETAKKQGKNILEVFKNIIDGKEDVFDLSIENSNAGS